MFGAGAQGEQREAEGAEEEKDERGTERDREKVEPGSS